MVLARWCSLRTFGTRTEMLQTVISLPCIGSLHCFLYCCVSFLGYIDTLHCTLINSQLEIWHCHIFENKDSILQQGPACQISEKLFCVAVLYRVASFTFVFRIHPTTVKSNACQWLVLVVQQRSCYSMGHYCMQVYVWMVYLVSTAGAIHHLSHSLVINNDGGDRHATS
jgi:hypothetical protein